MWVYVDNYSEGKKIYTVGFFRGDDFFPITKCENEAVAIDHVHHLNGGNTAAIQEATNRIIKAIDSLRHATGL